MQAKELRQKFDSFINQNQNYLFSSTNYFLIGLLGDIISHLENSQLKADPTLTGIECKTCEKKVFLVHFFDDGTFVCLDCYEKTKQPKAESKKITPIISDNGFPRRIRLDLYAPAEMAIREAVVEVEKAGAHPLLTDAVLLLGQAREKVADYVDLKIHEEHKNAKKP